MHINHGSTLLRIGAVIALTLTGILTSLAADPDELSKRGRERYMDDCAGCHGLSAHGDGAVADMLTIPPTDLTVLSRDNRGQFPEDYVRRVVDGRDLPSAAHGQVAMPVWGRHYQRTLPGYSEETVQRKIDELVDYLRSIQVE